MMKSRGSRALARWWLLLAGLVACLALVACDDDPAADDDDSGDDDDDTGDDDDNSGFPDLLDAQSTGEDGGCPHETRVGGFRVDMHPDYPSVSGSVADGVVPISILQLVDGSVIGDCLLEQRVNPVCLDPCEPDETCDYDGNCIPYPANHSIGTVWVAGLSAEVTMEPVGDPGLERYSFLELEAPAAETGAKVVIQAAGDAQDLDEGFTLHGQGIDVLELPEDDIILHIDQDLTLQWPATSTDSMVTINLNIDQHGVSPVRLYCETADTGSYTVPATLISQLMDAGITGYPSLTMVRRTIQRQDLSMGCVEFEVASMVIRTALVEGHIPCHNDSDCPEGMECDESIETCVDIEE